MFFGTGAYTVGDLGQRLARWPAATCSRCCRWRGWSRALIAIPVGLIALRVRRHTFVVITIAIFFIFQLMAFNLGFTGGSRRDLSRRS